AQPQPTLSRASHWLTRPTPSQGAQQQLMAKSVGIPDREHSVVSSRAKRAGMIGDSARIPSWPAAHVPPHKQAGHMTAPTSRQKDLAHPLRNGGRPHMTPILSERENATWT